MIKILQFGEGNFLRAFVDLYVNTLRQEGGDYAVTVVKPIPQGSIDAFLAQGNRYHVILRGMQDGAAVETVYPVDVLEDVFSPFENMGKMAAMARDPDLAIIVSNTTEAGICFRDTDRYDADWADITFPAKLTHFLYTRYEAGLGGVHLLPVELIENNADELYRCVDAYIRLWQLPVAFKEWNDLQNFYCNTLVDRIVSGAPRDAATKQHITSLVGEEDALATVAEPFGLWVIECKGKIETLLRDGKHNIEVVFTDDIGYYKRRKVRVLNGSHTNLVPAALVFGQQTVSDCMQDERLHSFFRQALEEIIPHVSSEIEATRQFAEAVETRFCNPYLNHQLTSIALNSIAKWRARCLPTFRDYYAQNGCIPPTLTVGFSYLMYLYQSRHGELMDEAAHLAYFAAGRSVRDFMANAAVWGEDLTVYAGFAEAVDKNIARIAAGEVLI